MGNLAGKIAALILFFTLVLGGMAWQRKKQRSE